MKRSAFIRNVITTVLFPVFFMSCNERAVESMQELKYHTHVFGVFQMKNSDYLITAVKVNIDAVCKNYCNPTSASTFRDLCLIRTDSTGTIRWEKTFQEQGDEGDFSAIVTTDDYLLISGNRGKDDFFDNGFTVNGFVAKFTMDGNLVWRKVIEAGRTQIFSAFSASEEGYIAKNISNKSTYGFVILDKNGVKKRETFLTGGIPNFMEVIFLQNGELLTLRVKDKNTTGGNDQLIEKFDKEGNLLWSRTVALPIVNLAKASDNGFWALDKKGWLGRFDADGELIGSRNLIFMNNRIIHFDTNSSGKLVLELLEGQYRFNQLHYFLINEKEVEIENVLPDKYEYAANTTTKPTFVHLLADKSSLVVEVEQKYVSGNTSPEGYWNCQLILSKLNSQGKRIWMNTVGKGKKSGILPLLVDI
jgi:hypothetical protein